jgi:hypothetical protein
MQMSDIQIPAHKPQLDTRHNIHATDGAGNIVTGDDGKPVQMAQDTLTGSWWIKVAKSMPFNRPGDTRKNPRLEMVGDMGGVYVSHDSEVFRGVWVPLEAQPLKPAREKAEKAEKPESTPTKTATKTASRTN